VHQQTDGNKELVRLARVAGIYVGVFLTGGAVTFAYSYWPLHDAKNWKISYLEERLEAKDIELQDVQNELAGLREESADKPDGQTFKMLQDELVTADKTAKELERKLAQAEKRAKEMEKSRDSWKAKYASSESEREELAAQRQAPADDDSAGAPAAPAPPAAPSAGAALDSAGEKVELGKRWRRDDGRAGFELVGIDGSKARVIADPDRLTPGSKPKVITVREGDDFSVGTAIGDPTPIAVRRVEAGAGIWIAVNR
jgi:hypothetical protein